MTIKLPSCPFCEGPPVPVIVRARVGGVFPDSEMEGDEGVFADAYVFCHECGAQGESHRGDVHVRGDCAALMDKAVKSWCTRDNRHRSLYVFGEVRGLNEYPRADGE